MGKKQSREEKLSKIIVKIEHQLEEVDKARNLSEQQFLAIANNAVDAIISINSQRKVIFWNKAAEKLFGYKKQEIMGQEVTIIMPQRYKSRHKRGVSRYIATSKSKYLGKPLEFEGLRRDGSEFPLELAVSGWKSDDKWFFTAIIRDITKRKQIETELKKAKDVSDHIAETLQESLIKPLPKIPGLEIATALKSAYETQRVGGDFFDIFQLNDNLVAILIGDVAGKGIDAAGLTETARSSVRTLSYVDPSPAFVFSKTNQALIKQVPNSMFITASLFMINTITGQVRFARAGHPPAILCSQNSCHLINAPIGYPLGTYDDIYEEEYFEIQKNQILVLYTDGLIEAKSNHILFSEKGALKALKKNKSQKPQDIIDALLKAAIDFSKGKLQDDIGLVAIRYKDAKNNSPN